MAFHLKHIPNWNALQITLNGKNSGGLMNRYNSFIESIPERVYPDKYSVLIPETYLNAYLDMFIDVTTMNQTIGSILGNEKTILPEVNYELQYQDSMKLQLYPFQQFGAAFLVSEKQAIIGDEVGLGKTPISLGAMHELIQSNKVQKALIIMPASLKYQWKDEIEKFTNYSSVVVDGTAKQRQKQYTEFKDSTDEFLIAGYETVRNDIKYFEDLKFDCITMDESHRIKNRQSQTYKAIIKLQPEYRFALTGTPMQNKPEEIFSLMSWIDKKVFGGVTKFNKRHILKGEKYGKRWVDLGYRYLDDIREQISPKMLRRLKKDVAPDLPEIIYTTIPSDMNKPQRTLYKAITEDFMALQEEIREFYENQSSADAERGVKHPKEQAILGYIYMMQAVSNHPLLLLQGNSKISKKYTPLIKEAKTSPKLDTLIEQIDIFLDQGSKIVIFSQYVRMLVFIREKVIHHFKQEPFMIYGDVPAKERQEQIKEFNTNPNRNIILLSDAGNAGLNLQISDILINYDSPWAISTAVQRNGRIHRINSEFDKVTIMNLITNDTIDTKIQDTLQRKLELNNSLVENTAEEVNIMQSIMADFIEE